MLAARISDETTHGGTALGPGVPSVLIEGLPAAVVGDLHECQLDQTESHPKESSFTSGSPTVLIGGMPVLRAGDQALCGAEIVPSQFTVLIG